MFKLLAIDLDGTLLTTDKTITERTRLTLIQAHATGVNVVLVSGRSLHSVLLIMEQLNLSGPRSWAIACNGALTWDVERRETVTAHLLEHEDILTLTQLGRDLPLECYQLDEQHLVSGLPVPQDAAVFRHSRMPVVSLSSGWEKQLRRKPPQMMFIEVRAVIDALADRLPSGLTRRYHFVRSEPNYFEVMRHGVDKGVACQGL